MKNIVRGDSDVAAAAKPWWAVAARIAIIAFVILLAMLGGLEFGLRRVIQPDPATEEMARYLAREPRGITMPRLQPKPAYITDAHGIFVGNHALRPDLLNAEGYRSPPFDEPAAGRTTVMIIGDSFAWGDCAEPLSEAFPDVVRRSGFRVCNMGIGGVGVRQYRAEADVYVPRFKPDVVCVMFYPGNDFEYEAPIRPGFPRFYVTDSMLLSALSAAGEPVSLEKAAGQFMDQYGPGYMPWCRRLASRSALYRTVTFMASDGPSLEQRTAIAIEELRAIQKVAAANGAKFLLFVLRVREGARTAATYTENTAILLASLGPHVLPPMDDSCYPPFPEYHYNNKGHAKTAAFILEELGKEGITATIKSGI